MPPKNTLLDIDQTIHGQFCRCRKCTPPMPGERLIWNPSPSVLITGMMVAALAIAINFFSFN